LADLGLQNRETEYQKIFEDNNHINFILELRTYSIYHNLKAIFGIFSKKLNRINFAWRQNF
jgi:hypothetical protein